MCSHSLRLHTENIPGFTLILKKTIFQLACLVKISIPLIFPSTCIQAYSDEHKNTPMLFCAQLSELTLDREEEAVRRKLLGGEKKS